MHLQLVVPASPKEVPSRYWVRYALLLAQDDSET